MKTTIPSLLQYPVGEGAFEFVAALVAMFYSPSLPAQARGLLDVAKIAIAANQAERIRREEGGRREHWWPDHR